MDCSSPDQVGAIVTNTAEQIDHPPEGSNDHPLVHNVHIQTKNQSTVYHSDSTFVSRSVTSITTEENPVPLHHVQARSLNSPASGKRVSPHEEDDETMDDGFQIVSNRKKKTINHVPSPNVMLSNNLAASTNDTEARQNRPISSTTTFSNSPIVTDAAARFALTRYPFPPFTIRFNCVNINIDHIKRDLVTHVANVHKQELNVIGCRRSKVRCNDKETDLLLHVKETEAFAILMSKLNWPSSLAGLSFVLPNMPSIPPQLSLLVKNVDLRLNLDEFGNDLKQLYPDVKNVIRMKNKLGNDINLVKLEITSVDSRNKLLGDKKLLLNHLVYEVSEYLAPVNVLICSKCCGIGHFRKQCPDQLETCRTCLQQYQDRKFHVCSNQSRCKHCNGDHYSSSNKCPVIKTFRSALTRQMMTRNEPINPSPVSRVGFIGPTDPNRPFNALPPGSWDHSTSPMAMKLDEMIMGLDKVNQTLNVIIESNKVFTQFMHDKTTQDKVLMDEISQLKTDTVKHNQNLSSLANELEALEKSTQQQSSMIYRIILPILDDLLAFSTLLNKDKSGRPLDADFRSRFGRFRTQVANAIGGNSK